MTDQETRQRFHKAVDAALAGLEGDPLLAQRVLLQARQKEAPKMKRKLSVGLVIALALALMSVSALAAGLWGIVDFYIVRYGTTPLDGMASALQTGIAQQGGQTSLANFTLREAICDGQAAYLVFDATPVDDHTLLVCEPVTPGDSAGFLGSEFPENMTVAEYAASKGYTQVVQVSVDELQQEGYAAYTAISFDDHVTESGVTLTITATGQFSGNIDMAFTCSTIIPADSDAGMTPAAPADPAEQVNSMGGVSFGAVLFYTPPSYEETATLTASLRVDEPLWVVSSSGPIDYPEAGVRVDSLTLTGTVMGIYADATLTVTDQAIYDSYETGFQLELVDEAGELLPSGMLHSSSLSFPDEVTGQIRYADCRQAAEQAPASIGIRAYNFWTRKRCETLIVELSK